MQCTACITLSAVISTSRGSMVHTFSAIGLVKAETTIKYKDSTFTDATKFLKEQQENKSKNEEICNGRLKVNVAQHRDIYGSVGLVNCVTLDTLGELPTNPKYTSDASRSRTRDLSTYFSINFLTIIPLKIGFFFLKKKSFSF
jgi:hypothetical protein